MFKRLKKQLSNMRNALSVKTYKTPRLFVIMTMVMINLMILIIAAFIVLIIDEGFSNFIEAFALGSVTWMLAPNAILAIDNPATLFLAVLVLIVGLVLFSGTIIALTTNTIRDYFDKKKAASGKIYLQNHIVILNWNNKVPALIADLVYVKSRKVSVLILADIEKSFAENRIKNALVKKYQTKTKNVSKMNVLIKRGDPLNQNELLDSSIEDADAILIMNQETEKKGYESFTKSDLNIVKIILSLGHLSIRPTVPIVSEVKALATKEKVHTLNKNVSSLQDNLILPICFDRRLGQIMAQTIIQNHMEDIYLSLFSFAGSEVYALVNTDFETVLNHHTHAIPIERFGDYIYCLAPNNQLKLQKSPENLVHIKPLKTKSFDEKIHKNIHIVGQNNKRAFIEKTFKAYERLYDSSFNLTMVKDDDIELLAEKINALEGDVTVLLLSDETQPSDALDANVLNNLLYLKQHLTKEDVYIIVELLDPKNDPLIKDFNIENTIISNKIISLLLSKLALFSETEKFYDDLLTIMPHENGKDAQALIIKKTTEILTDQGPIEFKNIKSFTASIYHAFDKKMIPIGIIRDEKVDIFTGPLHEAPFELKSDDDIVLIKM